MTPWLRLTIVLLLISLCGNSQTIDGWYEMEELRPGLYKVKESEHASFFVLKAGKRAIFIDSGLGLSRGLGESLLKALAIKSFDVVVTHAHLDHVGLNFMAKEIALSKAEWEKFLRLKESKQILGYHRHFKKSLPWPKGIKRPTQQPWKPTKFLKEGEVMTLGELSLVAVEVPGHTEGSLAYHEVKKGWLFTGDVVYESPLWPHYLNFADSSLSSYVTSLSKISALVAGDKPPLLLPAHGRIPLDPAYVGRIVSLTGKIAKGELKPKERMKVPPALSGIIVEAMLFEGEGASFLVKPGDLP